MSRVREQSGVRSADFSPLQCWLGCGLKSALLVVALALGTFSVCGMAGSVSAEFEAANKLYEQGKYSEAAAAYEKLVQTNETAPVLLFNLGNALFKAGRMGRAIAAYRQAERLTPRDPDVRANLQFARNQVQGPSAPPNRRQRWLGALTVNEWTLLTTGAVWLFFLLLAAGQWQPAWKRRLRAYSITTAAAAVALGACLGLALNSEQGTRVAIVIGPEAVVRNGPLDESKSAFTVYDGAELHVLDQKDDWYQVSDGGRRIGWLKRDAVMIPGREAHSGIKSARAA